MSTIASSPTTTSTFWPLVYRFAWKEVRKMRGFALGVAGLAVLLMIFCLYLHYSEPTLGIDNARSAMLLLGAFGGGAFVAIGAATTAFAVEREEQTDTFLLTLPRYWQAVFAGKLLGVCLLALTFSVGMGAVAWILGGFGFPSKGGLPLYLNLGTVLLAEATVWGLVVSLLVRRPLLAAVLACAATSFSSQIAIALANEQGYQAQAFADSLAYRWLLCGVGLVIAMLLARRWVNRTESIRSQPRGRRWQFTEVIPATVRRTMAASAITNLLPIGPTTSRSIFWRLVWQTWRESWQMMLGVVGVGFLLMWAVEGLIELSQDGRSMPSPAALMSTFFIPGLCGALVFRPDHRRGQHQFLTEHAGRPRLVWMARVFTWGTYLTVLVLLIVGLAAWVLVSWLGFQEPTVSHSPWANIHMAERQVFWSDFFYRGVPMAIFATFLAFALGQLASLLLKSEILAAGLSLFASIGVMLYCQLIWTWRLPPVWCLLPIALGALAATYFRIGDWLAARSTRASWSRVAAVAIAPVLVVVASLPMIRHAQIEWALNTIALDEHHRLHRAGVGMGPVDMKFSRQQLDQRFDAAVTEFEEQQRDAAEVAREYQVLLGEIRDNSPDDMPSVEEFGRSGDAATDVKRSLQLDYGEATPQQLDALIQLTKLPVAENPVPEVWIRDVAWILDNSARRAMSDGDLDLAWTRILALENFGRQLKSDPMARQTSMNHAMDDSKSLFEGDLHKLWALSPEQTPERIRNAVADLMAISNQYPTLQSDVIADYVDARAILNGGSAANSWVHPLTLSETALLLDRFPGEHNRAQLALRVFAMRSLQYASEVSIKSGDSLREELDVYSYSLESAYRSPRETAQRLILWRTANSSLLAVEIWIPISRMPHDLSEALKRQAQRRLEQLRLLLIAHHLQHGEYPVTLDGLAVDNTPALLAIVTIDPHTAQPFHFASRNFERMTWGDELWEEFSKRTDYAAPTIWSGGSWAQRKYQFPVDLRTHLPNELHQKLKPDFEYLMEGYDDIDARNQQTKEAYEANEEPAPTVPQWLHSYPVLPLPNENEYPNYEPPTPEAEATSPEAE